MLKKALKWFLFSIGIFALALILYWGKCQLNIDLIQGFAWERPFPFLNALQYKERILRPQAGLVFKSTFDGLFPNLAWGQLWSRDKEAVTHSLMAFGLKDSSCLRVHSASSKDWAYHSIYTMEVKAGDVDFDDIKLVKLP